ncbi:Spy/CpxP family protein refolding chaperone [Lutibacter sp.]
MKNNNNILIWAITILVILNLTIVGTILVKSTNCAADSTNKQAVGLNIPKSHLGQLFKDELNLTYKQHNKFREIRHKYHDDTDKIKTNMQLLRKQIIDELGKENSNNEYLNELSTNIGNLHKELKLQTTQYYLGMKEVCNKKQKEKLHQIFKKMINNEGNVIMPQRN